MSYNTTSSVNRIYGTASNDYLIGTNGRDLISGGGGNDKIVGKDGNDKLLGGKGHDSFSTGKGADSVYGGSGKDGVNYAQSDAGVRVDLAKGTGAGGHAQGDYLVSIEVLVGSCFDDKLLGSDAANKLYGLKGDDLLNGRGGNDMLFGDAGNDKVLGGTGNDMLFGGGGDDSLYGGSQNDKLAGGAGDDCLHGGGGRDKLFGGTGNDKIDGAGSNDYIVGGKGDDVIDGGAGFDTAVFSGVSSDYSITFDTDGVLRVGNAHEGYDTLTNVERFRFLGEDYAVKLSDFDQSTETLYHDIPRAAQYPLGVTGNDVFVFKGNASKFDWDVTSDGQGYVVWNVHTNAFDVLIGFESIRFDDVTVRLTGTVSEYADAGAAKQTIFGSARTDRFLINGESGDYDISTKADGSVVVRGQGGEDCLYNFEEIRFTDTMVSLDGDWV